MSLNYDLTKIRDREELHATDEGWRVTEAVIFGTMLADIGKITEDNAAEFHARLVLISRIHGEPRVAFGVTPEDVKRRVGLGTNVITKTSTQFLAGLRGRAKDELRSLTRTAAQ